MLFLQILWILIAMAILCKSDRIAFDNLVQKYNRVYNSNESKELRYQHFLRNAGRIKEARKNDPSAVYEWNDFFDLSEKEFYQMKLMAPRKVNEIPSAKSIPKHTSRNDLPESFDWREKGAVSSVRDQASCGSCFVFSAAQAVEGQYALQGNEITQFSTEYPVECDTYDCGCFGGWPYRVAQYIMDSNEGKWPSESDYPYCIPPLGNCYPKNTNTSYCPTPSYGNRTCSISERQIKKYAVVSGYEFVDKNEQTIQQELVTYGPLSILLNAEWFQFYSSGISHPSWCDPTELNHAVLLVGYGVKKSWLGNTNYWIIKNSWGSKWGMDGYIWLFRGDNTCGVSEGVLKIFLKNNQ